MDEDHMMEDKDEFHTDQLSHEQDKVYDWLEANDPVIFSDDFPDPKELMNHLHTQPQQ